MPNPTPAINNFICTSNCSSVTVTNTTIHIPTGIYVTIVETINMITITVTSVDIIFNSNLTISNSELILNGHSEIFINGTLNIQNSTIIWNYNDEPIIVTDCIFLNQTIVVLQIPPPKETVALFYSDCIIGELEKHGLGNEFCQEVYKPSPSSPSSPGSGSSWAL